MDFTLKIYEQLLIALKSSGYTFYTFEEYCKGGINDKYIVLRHDVDLKVANSVATARVEAALGIRASYFFRVVSQSNQPDKIRTIADLGHEIGYHYEDLSLFGGDEQLAINHFEKQLEHFRQFYPVKTICMHGSPTSKFDNKDLWKKYRYQDFDIIGEPYFDVDFSQIFYLTDTGRCWDGERYSVRDKVKSDFKNSYHLTTQIIQSAKEGTLPAKIMITTHPQRWTDSKVDWMIEYVMQTLKNLVKRIVVRNS